ncbi:MAG: S8 family peptidase [Clostridium sp.]|nr:S8 family peptidase [Clostridium sp.]
MRNIYLASLLAASALTAAAQSPKFDAATQMMLNASGNAEQLSTTLRAMSVKAPAEDMSMTFIVICEPSTDITAVEALGIDVSVISETCFIANLQLDQLEALAAIDGVRSVNANNLRSTMNDRARSATGVDKLHAGTGLGQSYTGKGVIAGLMDTGIDPIHVNFQDSEGMPRVTRYWIFNSNDGKFSTYDDDESIAYAPTDSKNDTHGTHVAGIMGGSYDQIALKSATLDESTNRVNVGSGRIQYKGMAPEAELVMAGGSLYDANILQAVRNIADYARQEGRPCVVNLSLGNNSGAHDGTDGIQAEMDKLAKEVIICVSAGNEGEDKIALRKTFTEEDGVLRSFIKDNKLVGITDMWGDSDTPFEASWVVYDANKDDVVVTFPADNSRPGETLYYGNSRTSYVSDPLFDQYFKGFITTLSQKDPNNGRWHIYTTATIEPNGGTGRYYLGLVITGKNGQHVDVYGNTSSPFTNNFLSDWSDGGFDGTINNMACGKNTIAVGSYATRTAWGTLGAQRQSSMSTNGEGEISRFSSWGHLADGRVLPDICGPGEHLISSMNSKYIDGNNIDTNSMVASASNWTGGTDYWNAMQGTSMSSPAVAGIIALWLEARPDLNASSIREIFEKTAIRDEAVTRPGTEGKWGAGKIDAYEGLKYALTMNSIKGTLSDNDDKALLVKADGNTLEAFVADAGSLSVTLFNMQGAAVASQTVAGDTATIPTSGLQAGVYVVSARSDRGTHTTRVVIR